MNFSAVMDFTSLTELMRHYADVDEIVFKSHCEMEESAIAEICHEGRRLAHQLKSHKGSKSAEEIALEYGCKIIRDAWQVAEGRIIFFAECSLHKNESGAMIRVNTEATQKLAGLRELWANESERSWFTEKKIGEVVIAHELFHLIKQQPPSTAVELTAHAFARAFTSLPFSPLLYNVLLMRLATGRKTLTL